MEQFAKSNGNGNGNGAQMPVAQRSEDIQRQIQSISGRDLQLWSIAVLVTLVLMAGFAAVIAPNLMWKAEMLHTDARYFPQLFFGLISLVLLFNVPTEQICPRRPRSTDACLQRDRRS